METIIQVNKTELRTELERILYKIRMEEQEKANKAITEQLMTAEEVMQALKVSSVTLWRYAKQGILTPKYIGGAKKFLTAEVQALIDGGK
ncbi:MAG: helix-turn-helix domain-containing protein [Alistipes sp.]|jgi:predicted DNA-binding transcriptional regulator AlpA|nr:helix-turn-helix domain-containing protein [Alistipes sp.]